MTDLISPRPRYSTGMRFLSRASDGSIVLASYHPPTSRTWIWSVGLNRKPLVAWGWRLFTLAPNRVNQWHDYYRLPFGWTLVVSRQDYHRVPA